MSLNHFDDDGNSRMVDVSDKDVTNRRATAVGEITMQAETLSLILDQGIAKGDVFGVAQLAGIMAAKRTSDLIPLCHPLPLSGVDLEIRPVSDRSIRIEATVQVQSRTGVEMEALTAVSVASLTVYDMCKAVDREMTLGPIQVVYKSGGQSGELDREFDPGAVRSRMVDGGGPENRNEGEE